MGNENKIGGAGTAPLQIVIQICQVVLDKDIEVTPQLIIRDFHRLGKAMQNEG